MGNLLAAVISVEAAGSEESKSYFERMFSSDGFHAPSISEFFPPAIFGEGTVFEFNRIMMVRVIAAAALILLFWIVASRARVVPGRLQSTLEMMLEFVKHQIVEPVMGAEGKRFVPFLTTLFLAIVFFNITGVVPFLNIASTSLIALPIFMAVWVYVLYLYQGVKKHGGAKYLKNALFPPGVPWYIYPLLTPIEALQVFVLRPATLALRLTANMIAGHLLLVLCFAATQYFFFAASGALKAMSAVTFAAGFAFVLFEIFVALLQAYVFTILSAVYLNMALEEEH